MEGHGKAVVPGTRGDDPLGPLGGAELQEQVRRTALLERPGHLEVLELHEAMRPGEIGERLRVRARRLVHGSGQPLTRRLDVRQRQHGNEGREPGSYRGWRAMTRRGSIRIPGAARAGPGT